MKKSNLNFLINALMFISMSAIVGIGFLIKFTLISGQERWLKYNDNVEMLMFGLDRHQWGKIHLIIGIVLVALLILHIILHWKLIASVYNRLFQKKYISTIIIILFTAICGLFIIFPFVIKPEIISIEHGNGRQALHPNRNNISGIDSNRHNNNNNNEIKSTEITEATKKHKHSNLEIEIRGYMTLNEISEKYNIPTEVIKTKLNISESFSNNQRVNRLRKEYDIEMHQIKDVIRDYKEDHK